MARYLIVSKEKSNAFIYTLQQQRPMYTITENGQNWKA